jgi:hypothetical protein
VIYHHGGINGLQPMARAGFLIAGTAQVSRAALNRKRKSPGEGRRGFWF